MEKLFSVVIPVAGFSKKLNKKNQPKCMSKLNNGQTIISRQIDIVNNTFPNSKIDIVVVVGFDGDSVREHCQGKNVKYVENKNYKDTSVSESIKLGIQNAKHKNVLVVYGDLVFNQNTLKNLDFNESFVVVEPSGFINDREVGINAVNNLAYSINYDVEKKWAQIFYLHKDDSSKFVNTINHKENRKKCCGFEILNMMMDYKPMNIQCPSGIMLTEVDNKSDMRVANSII